MVKVMIFIDGTWLYKSRESLRKEFGDPGFHFDYGKLSRVLARKAGEGLGVETDIVRTFLFGSYPIGCAPVDRSAAEAQEEFYDVLREQYHYETITFPIDFRGRRLRRKDRGVDDDFEPKEKCVDIALATAVLYYAAIPHAYDVAIALIGDQDFKPVLHEVRRLGKRVVIASVRGSCSPVYTDPKAEARLRDMDVIFLNDLLNEIQLKYERKRRQCASCGQWVWTTYPPMRGRAFYCPKCKERYEAEKKAALEELVASAFDSGALDQPKPVPMGTYTGLIKKLSDKGYGFVTLGEGRDFFFHLTYLEQGLQFESLKEDDKVAFEIVREPEGDRAGEAAHIRPVA